MADREQRACKGGKLRNRREKSCIRLGATAGQQRTESLQKAESCMTGEKRATHGAADGRPRAERV